MPFLVQGLLLVGSLVLLQSFFKGCGFECHCFLNSMLILRQATQSLRRQEQEKLVSLIRDTNAKDVIGNILIFAWYLQLRLN